MVALPKIDLYFFYTNFDEEKNVNYSMSLVHYQNK